MRFVVGLGCGWALLLAAVGLAASGCGDKGTDSAPAGNNCGADGTAGSCKKAPIGGLTWMAENLNRAVGNSWCYGNSADSCKKYGRLYDWETATTACPAEWRLPSREEWGDLAKSAGGTNTYGDGGTAGNQLKSTDGWNEGGNGADDYGFSALSGGYRDADGVFGFVGENGIWWTAGEFSGGDAYYRLMYSFYDIVDENYGDKSNGFSVRCVASL